MAVSNIHNGWRYDSANNRLDYYYRGTRAGHINASGMSLTGTLTSAGALTVTAGGLTVTDGGLTVTAGGATVTAGNLVTTAGDNRITAGNVRLGAVEAFATTEPTSAVVMKTGTAPAGAITTSGGLFSSTTVVRKIIADGTVSNVET